MTILRTKENRVLPIDLARRAVFVAGTLLVIAGCGGPDLNTGGRTSQFDQGLTGNYSGYGQSNGRNSNGTAARGRGTYARVEGSFELPEIQGNPFDYTENDV